LRRKSSHTSFSASTLEPPKPSASASSDSIFASNATRGRVHSNFLYACAWAAEFPAQALLRLRTDWQTEPVVVLDGRAPEEWVCSLNRLAERRGAAAGMTRLEAESMNGLRLLKRSTESEAAARAVMLECAAKFSPRIEEACPNVGTAEPGIGTACAFVLDIAGTERLFGPPAQLAARLREELAAAGFRASIAVSANFDTARMKAAAMRGIAVIAEGAEAEALARLPIAALNLDEEYAATFALWGIGTLGELAALPEAELVARMGPQARRWRALARGDAEHTFEPIEAEFALEEFCEFETPVEQIDSLLFVGARMIDCLATRAAGRALALRSLTAEMGLEGGGTHGCAIRPAVPTIDRKFLLKLLQLEIGAHPPQAAVVRLALRAEAGAQSKVQLGLFAPQTPEPSRLDMTLARLRAMVGEERVGSPVLEDTNRADGFRMEGFAIPGPKVGISTPRTRTSPWGSRAWGTHNRGEAEMEATPRMALRRVRPTRLVRVTLSPVLSTKNTINEIRAIPGPKSGTWGTQTSVMRPVAFSDGENRYEIAAAYGPWRTSGCWWALKSCDGAWDCEEWDVLAAMNGGRSVACLLTRDCKRNAWRLEAFYD
jgi:protein ImuB